MVREEFDKSAKEAATKIAFGLSRMHRTTGAKYEEGVNSLATGLESVLQCVRILLQKEDEAAPMESQEQEEPEQTETEETQEEDTPRRRRRR